MDDQLYHDRAKIISVYHDDTVRADIDLGLSIWIKRSEFINMNDLIVEKRHAIYREH